MVVSCVCVVYKNILDLSSLAKYEFIAAAASTDTSVRLRDCEAQSRARGVLHTGMCHVTSPAPTSQTTYGMVVWMCNARNSRSRSVTRTRVYRERECVCVSSRMRVVCGAGEK